MGTLLFFLGLLVVVVGSIMFLVEAFSAGVLWGLACFFLPIVQLFFLVTHWHNAKKAFYVQLAGYALIVLGLMLSPNNAVPTGPIKARPAVGWPTPR